MVPVYLLTDISLVCNVFDYVVCRQSGCLVLLLTLLVHPKYHCMSHDDVFIH